VHNPKDKDEQRADTVQQEFHLDEPHQIEAPSGLDLHPEPKKAIRVSGRVRMAIIGVGIALLLAFAYGGYRRTANAQVAAREAGLPRSVAPATQAGNEFVNSIPAGTAPLARGTASELQPPTQTTPPNSTTPCGVDPRTSQPYRYNPQTGQPCDGLPQERLVVRQAPVARPPVQSASAQNQPSVEEQRLIAAYQREQEANLAPTGVRASSAQSDGGLSFGATEQRALPRSTDTDISQVAALRQALTGGGNKNLTSADVTRNLAAGDDEYDRQNMQARKEAFLSESRSRQTDDYLRSTRNAPLSRYEIKAGWEIPAVLEQNLNSDLPGELKALVASNVYDTATGMYLLIPQGSRLIGRYDSRVSYGQDGVQVSWNRVIYPDASTVDLDGMVGLDSHGNAGLRDKVDHHYKRVIGFSALTSMFTAAFAISQRTNQSVLAYPTPGQAASQAVGQDLSQTGAQITHRNLNVQPTIKVPVGYKFTVRVNRDILFEAPYEPMEAEQPEAQTVRLK
jgi:type IV secretory pathway VirB10-like protein